MELALLIAGLIALLLAGVPFWFARGHARRALAVRRTETVTVAELEDLRSHAAAAVGSGFWAQTAEVKGMGELAQPLIAPITQTPCAAFRTIVRREYEEDRWERDAQGRTRTRRHRASEVVSKDEQMSVFTVRDGTGVIEVDPQGAHVDYLKVADRFEPARPEGTTISIGTFSFTVSGGGGSRTLGYRSTEEVLPIGRMLYVLGEANDREGRLLISKPTAADTPYLISYRSEADILASASRWAFWLRVAVMALLVAGVALLFTSLLMFVF